MAKFQIQAVNELIFEGRIEEAAVEAGSSMPALPGMSANVSVATRLFDSVTLLRFNRIVFTWLFRQLIGFAPPLQWLRFTWKAHFVWSYLLCDDFKPY